MNTCVCTHMMLHHRAPLLQCLIHLITINDNTSTRNRYVPTANHFKFSVPFHFVVFYSRRNHVRCYVSSSLSFYSPIIIRCSTMYRSKSILCHTIQPNNTNNNNPSPVIWIHIRTLHEPYHQTYYFIVVVVDVVVVAVVLFCCCLSFLPLQANRDESNATKNIVLLCLLFQKIWAVWYAI